MASAPSKTPVVHRAKPVVPKPAPTRIQVVGRTGPGVRAPAAPLPAPVLAPAPQAPAVAPYGITHDGMAGAAILVLSVTALVLNFTLPWMRILTGFGFGDVDLDRSEVVEEFKDAGFYAKGLTLWPLVAAIGAIALGAGLLALDFLGLDRSFTRNLRLAAAGGVAFFGFLLTLMAARFLSLSVMDSWSNQNRIGAGAAAYVNLAAGLLLFALAGWRLFVPLTRGLASEPATSAMRWTFRALAVIAVAMLLNPFLPMTKLEVTGAGNDAYLGEASLAESDGLLQKAGDDLGFILGSFWIILYILVLCAAAAVAEREGSRRRLWSTLVQVQAFTIVPIIVGLIFSMLLYSHLDNAAGGFGVGVKTTVAFNFIPPLAFLGLLAIYVFYVRNVLSPFLRATASDGGVHGA